MQDSQIEIVPGKWYVIDRFSGPVSGPFDSRADAERDRLELNIADDCFVATPRRTIAQAARAKTRALVGGR